MAADNSKRRIILLVDDNPDIQTALAISMEHHGFRVVATGCGIAAIEMLESVQPEFAMIDYGLPDIDGIEVGARIRMHPKAAQTRLILFSGHYDLDLARQAKSVGFEDYLVKPIRVPELLERLN